MTSLVSCRTCTLTRVEMTAALGSGRAPLPSLPQPWPRVAHLTLGRGPSRFEARRQPFKGRPVTRTLTLTLTRYMHYTGYLLDGTKFDTSYDGKGPFKFRLGEGKVSTGWRVGLGARVSWP